MVKKSLLLFSLSIILFTESYGSSFLDSLISNIFFEDYLSNDDNPISNQKPYEERRRDDHGLTLSVGFKLGLGLKLSKKIRSNISFVNQNSFYTKGLGTSSTIDEDNPYYNDYKYLLEKHPDWSAIRVHNQVAYSKQVNQLEFENIINQNYIFGLQLKRTVILSGEKQFLADFQRNFHRILGARNYYHVPFTDSTIFDQDKISYFSLSPKLGLAKVVFLSNRLKVNSKLVGGIWINFSDKDYIPEYSPFINAHLRFGLTMRDDKRFRRFELDYNINYEPNEIIQVFADPGTDGFHYLGINFNLTNGKRTKRNYYFIFTVTPYSLYIPIGNGIDKTIGYESPEKDLRITESFFNFSIKFVFNEMSN